jgi:hypothetical protein
MKKLKHPIRAIREPFGTAGLIIAMIALVAALGGTALAAAKLNSTQKKEVEKIAKKYAGKPGGPGANGTNGAPGAKGDAGTAGSGGANGTSVIGKAITGSPCPAGVAGVEYTSASGVNTVCNGKNGTTGFTETLPSGKTETGAWSTAVFYGSGTPVGDTALSFTIPLETPLDEGHVHFFEAGEVPSAGSGCFGGTPEEPTAEPGNLCVYTAVGLEVLSATINDAGSNVPGAARSGAALVIVFNSSSTSATGTWAVTAP